MITMVIADDERLIRESLHQIIPWSQIGVEVVATAANGKQAIDAVLSLKPDILLSDIEMPECNGIKLAQTLRDAGSPCKVIFLSAYTDFAYAQKAIQYGVVNYVLKPIDEAVLLRTVSECAQTVRSSRMQQKTLENAHQATTRLTSNALKWHLMGEPSANPADQLLLCNLALSDTGEVAHRMLLVRGIDAEHVLSHLPALPDVASLRQFTAYVSNTEVIILWQVGKDNRSVLTNQFAQMTAHLATECADTLTFALSNPHCGLSLFRHFPECSFSLLLPQYGLQGVIHSFEETASLLHKPLPSVSSDNLLPLLASGQHEQIEQALQALFLGFVQSETLYDLPNVKVQCITLLDELGQTPNPFVLSQDEWANDFMIPLKIRITECASIFDVYTAILRILLLLSGAPKYQNAQTRLVRQAIQYIYQNYPQAKLTDVASQLYVSPTYLSRIFATEVGESFSHYLLRHRITKAKDLLADPQLKVYEIAQAVGYSDIAHFSKAFKQLEGISPAKYRAQIL